ncbi:MAG: S8 family serine peptidase [Agriterribacter sp.]
MKQFNTLHLVRLFLMGLLCMQLMHADAQDIKSIAPGKLLVKFKPSAIARVQQTSARLTGVKPEQFSTGIAAFDAAAKKLKAVSLKRVFPYAGKMEAKQRRYGLDRWYILETDKNIAVHAAVASFKNVAEVEKAEPSFHVAMQPYTTKPLTSGKASPMDAEPVNDPFYPRQWHYHNTGQVGGYPGADINLPEAWKINAGNASVIVDVVDEGVDFKHEDLTANMWKNMAELNGEPGVDDDGNGYIDDIYGYNFADNTGAIAPGDHGTHTAGTIAATNNNGIGVAGIAGGTGKGDGVRIMSSQIFSANDNTDESNAAAIVYGANNGAVISQNSWGYNSPDVYAQVVLDAIDYFIKEAGRDVNGKQVGPMDGGVVIFASGNSDISDPSYPGYYSPTIAVSSTTVFDNKSSFSNYGSWVDISAPGGEINVASEQEVASTFANNKYGYMAGTSMACPHVSGVAALIVSQFGKLGFTNEDLKNRLFATTDKFLALNPAYNGLMGVGRLNAGKALQPDKVLPPFKITDLTGISNAQNSIDLSWTAPADADNGNAQSYILYYAQHSFDSTQKDTLQKKVISKALAAGLKESFNLDGLLPSTEYYIAVASKDLWGNESSLSNLAKVTTKQGPVIDLPTTGLTININVTNNPQQQSSLLLGNKGAGPLTWNATAIPVSSDWGKKDGFNDTLKYTTQDWIGGYVGDDEQTPFSAATRFNIKGKAFNLTHIANGIQTQGIDKPIWAYIYKGGADPSKGTLLLKQQITGAEQWGGLLVTKLDGMFVFQPGEWFWIVYEYDGEYGYAQGYESNAADSLSNNFLSSSNNGKSWVTIASLFQKVSFYMYALSNDGYFGGFVSLQPNTGIVNGNASANIAVNANATTVRNGTYQFRLQFNSNDLNNPFASTPLTVNVSGQTASLTTSNGLLDCKNVFLGKSGDASVMLHNAGLSKLYDLSLTSADNHFTNISLPDTLYPGDSGLLTIRFTPTTAGLKQAVITIASNGGTLKLSATGSGVEPPVMMLSGVPVQIVAKADSTGKNTFTISNKTGKYPLNYSFPAIAAVSKAKAAGTLQAGTEPFGQYLWIDDKEPGGPVYSWTDIAATGIDITAALATEKKTAKLFPLGFPMRIYDDTVSQLYVTSLGMLSFNYPGSFNTFSASLPITNDAVQGCIAPLWYQVSEPGIKANMKVYIKYEPGKFIVQYSDVEQFDGSFFGGGTYSLGKATYQVTLYSDGKIAFTYKDVSNAQWVPNALIGLENKAETKGYSIADWQNAQPWLPTDNSVVWFIPVTPQFITSVKALNGAVAPGDSVKIEVTASAKNLIDSTYKNELTLTTNDPVNESLNIPVFLTVTGVRGVLQKTDSLHFGSIYKGDVLKQDAVLMNTGTKAVKLISASFNNAAFTTSIQPVSIPAMSELRIPVSFSPVAESSYTGILTVVTDNPSPSTFKVVLDGSGVAAPSVSYSFTGDASKTLNIGETVPASVKISNNGTSDLKVMIEHPQWLLMTEGGQGVNPGLDSGRSYTVHQSVNEAKAGYQWIELADSLGNPTIVDQLGLPYQEIKLPFTLPYFGKNYTSLFLNFLGDLYVKDQGNTVAYVDGGFPSADAPNGIITTANLPLYRFYNDQTEKYEGEIYYYTDSSKLVVEYYNVGYNNFFATGTITYEIIIYKDGSVKVLYKDGAVTSNFTHKFLIGMENEDGTDGVMAFNRSMLYKDKSAIEFVPSLSHTLKAGESIEVPATWSTHSMIDGVYDDELRIVTNDPLNKKISIPLQLTVIGKNDSRYIDTIAYGKIIPQLNGDGIPVQFTKQLTMENKGYKTVTINEAQLSDAYVSLDPNLIFPVVIAPGETFKTNVFFAPDSTLSTYNQTITLTTDEEGRETVSIPVTANVVAPPLIATDSSVIRILMQQNDSAIRYVKVLNDGKGDLDYDISLQYRRQGITYSSVSKSVLSTAKQKQQRSAFAVPPGVGHGISLMGANQTFVDSLIKPVPGNNFIQYMGFGDDSYPIISATRFVTGDKPFNLSHVGNLYRTSSAYSSTAILRIKLGSEINSAVTVREQTVMLEADTAGRYIITKLDSSLALYADETFWIEWEYSTGMEYPQGIQFVPAKDVRWGDYFYKLVGETSFRKDYASWRYYVNAYAQDNNAKEGWLTLAPLQGIVEKGGSQQLTIKAKGQLITPAEEYADIIIHSNDIISPETKVRVNVRIDQAPYLTKHDTLTVNEGDTLRYLVPAVDAEGSDITIKATDTLHVKIDKVDEDNYFVYTPDYADSGWHYMEIELSDVNNNKRKDTLLIHVLNVNRSPETVKYIDTLIMYVGQPALQMSLDSVFNDADGDTLQYSFTDDTSVLADVYVDKKGLLSIIPKDTGMVQLRFSATDPFAAMAADTIVLLIKNNTPPVVGAIPNIVIEAGAPPQHFDLSAWFSDADAADPLQYQVSIDSTVLATGSVANNTMTLTGLNAGNTVGHITADDGHGGKVTGDFLLTVLNNKGDIVNDYHITVAPNPVRNTANIRFQLGESKKVRIDVIGMDGKLQAVFFEGNQLAGNHTIQANLTRLVAGNYLIRFTIDDKQGTIQIAKL